MGLETMMYEMLWSGVFPVLATASEVNVEIDTGPMVLAGVLLSLVVIYLASKLGGEISRKVDLPPVLGELVGGVVVGVSVLHLLVFPEGGATASDSLIMSVLQQLGQLSPQALESVYAT
ncbi:MAG: cation:proton antiporter, partial [Spirulinaceae cyanobacterium]